MHYYFTAISLIAGICLGFGILYLFIGLRRKDNKPLNLTFALFALCYAATLFNGIRWYSATTVTEYVAVSRYDSIFVVGAFVGLIWYVALYTDFKSRVFPGILTAIFVILGIVEIISPTTFYGQIFGLIPINLPWNEKLATLDSAGSIWFDILLLAELVTLGFIIFALARQYWRGKRQPAIILALGILPFITGILYEILGESGIVPYIPFGELGFLGIAIAASLQMANSVIKTEESLEQHRYNLEGLVEERTAELSQSNEQLVQEIDERKLVETALNQRVDELATLHQTARTFSTVTELRESLQQISEMVMRLFDARITSITIPDNEGTDMTFLARSGSMPADAITTGPSMPLADMPTTSQVLTHGKPVVLSNLQMQQFPNPARKIIDTLNLHTAMFIPLVVRGVTIGVMSIASDQTGRVFTAEEVNLAETLATDIAAAIENANLLEQTKTVAAAEERNRIARELHDSVTQTLYSVSIVAEALPRVLDRNLEEGKQSAQYLRRTTLGALAEMRTLLFELRPDALAKAGLSTLLQQLADVLTGRTRIPVDVNIKGEVNVLPEEKITLYRIAQEALNNVAKHSQATQVWVTLQGTLDKLSLTIRDNGQGFNPDLIPGDRLGLKTMRERAAEIGADYRLNSSPGQGTSVSIQLTDNQKDAP